MPTSEWATAGCTNQSGEKTHPWASAVHCTRIWVILPHCGAAVRLTRKCLAGGFLETSRKLPGPPDMHPSAAHGARGRAHCQGTPKAWPTWPTSGVGGGVGLGAVGVAMHFLPVWPGNRTGCWKFPGKFRPPQARAGRWAAGAQGPSTPRAKPHGPQVVWGPLWGLQVANSG